MCSALLSQAYTPAGNVRSRVELPVSPVLRAAIGSTVRHAPHMMIRWQAGRTCRPCAPTRYLIGIPEGEWKTIIP
jgi:hypothetical protein